MVVPKTTDTVATNNSRSVDPSSSDALPLQIRDNEVPRILVSPNGRKDSHLLQDRRVGMDDSRSTVYVDTRDNIMETFSLPCTSPPGFGNTNICESSTALKSIFAELQDKHEILHQGEAFTRASNSEEFKTRKDIF